MTRQGDGDLAIVGLGMVTEPQPGRSVRRIEAEAARLAIEDAGLRREDVDGAIQLTMHAGSGSTPSFSDAFPRLLGLPVKFYSETGRGGGIAAQGIMAAARYLELGIANYVVVAVGANGWSRARRAREQRAERGNARAGGKEKEGYWGKPFGDLRAVSHHSFFAARHMHEFGTTSEQLGRIAVAIRQWATLNPRAKMYGRPMTLEDHQRLGRARPPLPPSRLLPGVRRRHCVRADHRRPRQGRPETSGVRGRRWVWRGHRGAVVGQGQLHAAGRENGQGAGLQPGWNHPEGHRPRLAL